MTLAVRLPATTGATTELSAAGLRRAIAVLNHVIELNALIARAPGHAAATEQRIIDGEIALAALEARLAAL